jgi:hypothetical protein
MFMAHRLLACELCPEIRDEHFLQGGLCPPIAELDATHNHPGANRRQAAQPAQRERLTDAL